jgi:hypothetical protein
MGRVSNQIDANLAHLAWSLWAELGVAGLERRHRVFSIAPEELIILTSALSEFDPRLRNEALDWCIRYHRFVSPIRLHILAKKYKDYIAQPFSAFSATLNATADIRTKWAVLIKTAPLKLNPSGKSILRAFEIPSMINFRLRSFLGVGAKADVMAFLLTEEQGDFVTSDLTEIGYSKRRLSAILEDFAAAGILSESKVRNQLRYRFVRQDQFIKLIGDIPQKMIHWNRILAVLLPIRACLQDVEDAPVGVRVIDMRNLLNKLSSQLLQIKFSPPPLKNDFEAYWSSVTEWLLEITHKLAQGELPDKSSPILIATPSSH